jgi:hypothetical protein
MNNVLREGGFSGHQDGTMTAIPRILLNADVTAEEKLKRRSGYRLLMGLPNAHSVWGNRRALMAAAEGSLYRFYPDGTKVNVAALSGPEDEKLYYATVDDKVYASSRHWMGIFDPDTNVVSPWGIPLPTQPALAIVSGGSLVIGRYQVCFTNVVNGIVGGNGMIAEIDVVSEGCSISILNRPADSLVWVTDPDGHTFYKSIEGGSGGLITAVIGMEPLPTFLCGPPSPMRFVRLAFGRIWGSIENRLVYSEPYRYDLFKSTNVFPYSKEIQMVAVVTGGVFVGFDDRAIFLAGTEPQGMQEVTVGAGVKRNVLAYCNNVPELGNNVPVWLSKDGLVAGSHSGQAVLITDKRIQFPAGSEGAAGVRVVNGMEQYLASYKQARPQGSGVGFGDSATCEVVRNGRVI